MTSLNRNISSVQTNWLENYDNSTIDKFKIPLSHSTSERKRLRREDYGDDDDYEIVCKHSNTGILSIILGAY